MWNPTRVLIWAPYVQASSRSRGALGARTPLASQDFFKIMQFSGNFKGKTLILGKFWAQGPPLGVKTPLGPPDLDPRSAPDASGLRSWVLNRWVPFNPNQLRANLQLIQTIVLHVNEKKNLSFLCVTSRLISNSPKSKVCFVWIERDATVHGEADQKIQRLALMGGGNIYWSTAMIYTCA